MPTWGIDEGMRVIAPDVASTRQHTSTEATMARQFLTIFGAR
jgi:hypothetical protein